MTNALFAFDDPQLAQAAVQHLLALGLPADSVVLHQDVPGAHQRGLENADELVTGGLLHNLVDLFKGTMDWGASPHDAAPYAETIRRGGAVVSVDAAGDDERLAADRAMTSSSFAQRTDWK